MRSVKKVNSSIFGDPVATETEWGAANRFGLGFCTHRLVQVTPDRVEFRATMGLNLFLALGIIPALAVLPIAASRHSQGKVDLDFEMAAILAIVVGSVLGTLWLRVIWGRPRVFDKQWDRYSKGHKGTALGTIHALQILLKHEGGDRNSFHTHELNLVLKNGERINVIDHGNKSAVQEDAGTLGAFLDRPVWDGTGAEA